MKFLIVGSLICVVVVGLTVAKPIDADTQLDPVKESSAIAAASSRRRSSRDLFVTTGWGGAGLPYSTFYITGKQLKEIRNESNGEIKKNDIEPNPEIISLVNCKECSDRTGAGGNGGGAKRTEKQKTVPQLFSSSGWGPLGRR